jgi:eukaryotic-like serine/threonine-protein kinase
MYGGASAPPSMQPRIHRRTRPYPGPPSPGLPAGVPQQVDDDVEPRRIATHAGPLRPGERVGRYVVRNKLGRGGMGVVWGAYDPVLGRRVALKLVRHRDALEAIEAHVDERLRREAQALARLSHPNVVSLYDVGTCEHGDYLALELVPGVDLEQWLHKATRSWKQVIEVFLLAGRGLAAAHTAGLIHRDFKPANVIVGPQGHVTVVDFGLARSAELDTTVGSTGHEADDDDAPADPCSRGEHRIPADSRISGDALALLSTRLTGTNMIVGTRGYMAPEQLLGLSVGPRADQFSFCVALFEAFYGVRPYPGTNAVETATAYSKGAIITPPDRHGVPARVHHVLLRGLRIEPDDRFPSMDALLVALRRAMPGPRTKVLLAAALVATATVSGLVGAKLQAMLGSTATAPTPSAEAAVPRELPGDPSP